jgi:hypothetical protein
MTRGPSEDVDRLRAACRALERDGLTVELH